MDRNAVHDTGHIRQIESWHVRKYLHGAELLGSSDRLQTVRGSDAADRHI